MKFGKKTKESISRAFIWVSVLSVILAGVGAMGTDIWLASTQWLLVAAVSILFAIYLKMS
ncbi:hypothetical protein COY29_01630 [Candidatus Woesebacteria bacterium CG_4_10_14_0_2_um_filter_39_14]|uniref:Uncharacterized protein n=2 Tax=Candidatus Woeseibacteriota TaxID=1752722 RepID=A0A2M7X9T9_9BACT|nr:MAG: hypothetical protein COY29_01630 [Candidatus Woesebacteria bacterium CG_4_10_14_0_2_um_filter_39_14]PJA42933.1 MAG: hypothetical protein CO176_00900 [Candidatus Woesebacteria bacterium CG_4_9_14_3_um_filter_39_10]